MKRGHTGGTERGQSRPGHQTRAAPPFPSSPAHSYSHDAPKRGVTMLSSRASRRGRISQNRSGTVEPLEARRLLSAGDLDPTFGAGGKVVSDLADARDTARAAVVQSDGKTVVVG